MKKFVKVSMVGITVNEIELKSALTEGLKMASENNCVLYLAGDGRNEDHVKKFITAISKGIEYAAHYGVNYRVISVYGTKDELPKKRHKQVDYVVAANISTISAETRALLIRDALVNKANFMVGDAPVSPTEPEKDNKKENPVVSQNVLQDNVEWHDDLDDIPDETFGVSSENGPVIIYTDGAAKGNSQSSPAGWAFVYQDGSKKESGSFFGSNNVAELLAIKKALESTSESAEVEIHSDSQYSIGVLGGSKDGSIPFMKAKTNLNLIAEIQDLMASKTVTFVKVKGHDGHPMNELVDKMASDAAKDNNG